MVDITVNGVKKTISATLSVKELIDQLGYDRRRIAVEINQEVVPSGRHPEHQLQAGDAVEIVTLVGGGSEPRAVAGLEDGRAASAIREGRTVAITIGGDHHELSADDLIVEAGRARQRERCVS